MKVNGIDIDFFRKHTGQTRPGSRRIEEALSPEQKFLTTLQTAMADAKEASSSLWSTTDVKNSAARKEREKVALAISKLEKMVAGWEPTR